LSPKQDVLEKAKRTAAIEAVRHVKDGYVVGLGSGSTAALAIVEIGRKMKKEKIHVMGVPTSYQAFMLAVKNGVPTTTLEENPVLDLVIDGADQVDKDLNMIKGMGGALAREKIVAGSSKFNVIVVDATKKVKVLGENNQPVPIEVLPFAVSLVDRKVREIKGKPILREGKGKVGPVVTDNGNLILDVDFGLIHKPRELASKIEAFSGVVETGLFVELASVVYVGSSSGVEKLVRK